MKRRVAVVTGARPTFIDLAPVLKILARHDGCELFHYNTGQHYDDEMSKVFFNQLDIPRPTFQSDAVRDAKTHAEQTGIMMVQLEEQLAKDRPDIVVVKGDTNSALAGALAAGKMRIPVAHVEAGFRSYDDTLPEELNRKVIGQIALWHYSPHKDCTNNLILEGVKQKNIFEFGHPVIDSINLVKERLRPQYFNNGRKHYFVTIHRDFNVDNEIKLADILRALNRLAIDSDRTLVFPIHPRTKKRIEEFGFDRYLKRITTTGPLDYITCLSLERDAYAVITDSGGIQKECTVMGIPMITVRPNIEMNFTLRNSVNQLAFNGKSINYCVGQLEKNYSEIRRAAGSIGKELSGKNGSPSERIASHITTNILPSATSS